MNQVFGHCSKMCAFQIIHMGNVLKKHVWPLKAVGRLHLQEAQEDVQAGDKHTIDVGLSSKPKERKGRLRQLLGGREGGRAHPV